MAFIHSGTCLVDLAKAELNSDTSQKLIEAALQKFQEASQIPGSHPDPVSGDFLHKWGLALLTQYSLLAKISDRNEKKSIDPATQKGMKMK